MAELEPDDIDERPPPNHGLGRKDAAMREKHARVPAVAGYRKKAKRSDESAPARPLPARTTSPFQIKSPYQPAGDQPKAIRELAEGLARRDEAQVLLGITGSGKTYTV